MIRFHEHIIRLDQTLEPALTREELWREMESFARNPEHYVEGVSGSHSGEDEVLDGGVRRFKRTTDFGGRFSFVEHVTLTPGLELATEFAGGAQGDASRFAMRIEEPEPGRLFARFVYENESAGKPADPRVDELRRRAYEAKDRDAVSRMLLNIDLARKAS